MSDELELTAVKIEIPRRKVKRTVDGYSVFELSTDGWHSISKPYQHSTSAYASLGRMTSQECQQ